MDFQFLFVLYEGSGGYPAVPEDCVSYANTIDNPDFPIFADGNHIVADATPLTNNTHPEMCSLTPELEIIKCYSGHGGYEDALQDIKNHAGL